MQYYTTYTKLDYVLFLLLESTFWFFNLQIMRLPDYFRKLLFTPHSLLRVSLSSVLWPQDQESPAPPTEPARCLSLSSFLKDLKLYLKVRRVLNNHLIWPTFPFNAGISSNLCHPALNHFHIAPVSFLSTTTWDRPQSASLSFPSSLYLVFRSTHNKIAPFHTWQFFKYLKLSVPALHPPQVKLVLPVISHKWFLIFFPFWTLEFQFAPNSLKYSRFSLMVHPRLIISLPLDNYNFITRA